MEELRTGATNAEIAVRLGVSVATVKYHVGNMLAKLELKDRHELAAWHPRPERRRLPGFVVPAGLASLGRPLAWVGAGIALATGVAVLTVTLVAMKGEEAPGVIRPTTAPASTATPATTPLATATSAPLATPASGTDQDDGGLRRIEGLYTPGLLVVTDGAPRSLILEWSVPEWFHEADTVHGWQYQRRLRVSSGPEEWGPLTHIPGSEGVTCLSSGPDMATCSYRVTGLHPNALYDFRVGAGSYTTGSSGGMTPEEGVPLRIPRYGAAKGDGHTVWGDSPTVPGNSSGFLVAGRPPVVIPEGMRLRDETPVCLDCGYGIVLRDLETGSLLRYWSTRGGLVESPNLERWKLINAPPPRWATQFLLCQPSVEYSITGLPDRTPGRDVVALFHQMIAPPTSPPTCRPLSGGDYVVIPLPD